MNFTTNNDTVHKAFKKHLQEYAAQLEPGIMNTIAERTGFSPAYVTRFFKGDYNLTSKNECILSAGIDAMEDFYKEKEKQNSKVATKVQELKNVKTDTSEF